MSRIVTCPGYRGLAVLTATLSLTVGCGSSIRSPDAVPDGGRDAGPTGSGGAAGATGAGGNGGGSDAVPGSGGSGTGGASHGGNGGSSTGGASDAGSGGGSDIARGTGGSGTGGAVDAAGDAVRDVPNAQDALATEVRDAGPDSPALPEAGGALDGPELTTVNYLNDPDTIFANPERGFYRTNEVQTSSYQALDLTWLQNLRTQNAVSLVFHMVYLDSFVNSDLSQSFLAALAADFATMRKAGVKAVVRFAYTSSSTAPYGDASKTRVLGHITQLGPVLFANSDVIAVLQAGFIGAWGEWYYTDTFGDQGSISASQWTDRQDVVTALLGALDLGRPIQLRTPAFKQHFYGTAALTSSEAFAGTDKARVGHHNDCFLASADDEGTYASVTADKAYLAQENLYVPQGGETCATSTYSNWTNAQTDMTNLHWSFLNMDYQPDVLASWGANIDIAKRRLGYRLRLETGAYPAQAEPGGEFDAQFTIRNDGFAPPFAPRELNLVLRGSSATYVAKLPDDPRRFVPGAASTVVRKVCLPATMAVGSYTLWLALPDPTSTLNPRAEYSIRLANQGTWESSTGYNDLNHTLSVTTAAPTPACGADAIAAVAMP